MLFPSEGDSTCRCDCCICCVAELQQNCGIRGMQQEEPSDEGPRCSNAWRRLNGKSRQINTVKASSAEHLFCFFNLLDRQTHCSPGNIPLGSDWIAGPEQES